MIEIREKQRISCEVRERERLVTAGGWMNRLTVDRRDTWCQIGEVHSQAAAGAKFATRLRF